MSTVAEKKLSKRLKILEAAYRLFSDNSVNTTAIDDVVKLAGVAKGTFYLYFKDKYDLLDQIIIYKSVGMLADISRRLELIMAEKNVSVAGQMTFIIDGVIAEVEKNRKLAAIMSTSISACICALEQSDNPTIIAQRERLVRGCCENGMTANKARAAIYTVADMALSAYFDAIFEKLPCSPQEVMPMIHSLISNTFKGGDELD